MEPAPGDEDGVADPPEVEAAAKTRREGLQAWQITEDDLRAYADTLHLRLVTPGSDAGEPLHLLSALERRSDRWDTDEAAARANLSAAVSLVLRLTGRDGDPGRSREHALLSVLAEARATGELVAKELGILTSKTEDAVQARMAALLHGETTPIG